MRPRFVKIRATIGICFPSLLVALGAVSCSAKWLDELTVLLQLIAPVVPFRSFVDLTSLGCPLVSPCNIQCAPQTYSIGLIVL